MSARIIEVIEVETTRGNGKTTPIRRVMQYYDRNGGLLAESDVSLQLALTRAQTRDAIQLDDLFALVAESPHD